MSVWHAGGPESPPKFHYRTVLTPTAVDRRYKLITSTSADVSVPRLYHYHYLPGFPSSRDHLMMFFRIFVRGLPPVAARLALLRWRRSSRAPAGSLSSACAPMSKERPDSKDAGGSSGHSLCARHAPAQQHQLAGRSPRRSPFACALCAAVPTTSRAGRAWTSSGRTARIRRPTGR